MVSVSTVVANRKWNMYFSKFNEFPLKNTSSAMTAQEKWRGFASTRKSARKQRSSNMPVSILNRNDTGQYCRHRFGSESMLACYGMLTGIGLDSSAQFPTPVWLLAAVICTADQVEDNRCVSYSLVNRLTPLTSQVTNRPVFSPFNNREVKQ